MAPTRTRTGAKTPITPSTRSSPPAATSKPPAIADDVRRAIFAYNHADWYVDSVLLRARLIAGVPADLVGSLTGLTEGRFPVAARARYADDLQEHQATKRVKAGQNAANIVNTDDTAAKSRSTPAKVPPPSPSTTAKSKPSTTPPPATPSPSKTPTATATPTPASKPPPPTTPYRRTTPAIPSCRPRRSRPTAPAMPSPPARRPRGASPTWTTRTPRRARVKRRR